VKSLEPRARQLLAEYRSHGALTPAARSRVARAIEQRLASGDGGSAGDAIARGSRTAPARAPGRLAALTKLGLVCLAVSWVGLGASRLWPAPDPPQPAQRAADEPPHARMQSEIAQAPIQPAPVVARGAARSPLSPRSPTSGSAAPRATAKPTRARSRTHAATPVLLPRSNERERLPRSNERAQIPRSNERERVDRGIPLAPAIDFASPAPAPAVPARRAEAPSTLEAGPPPSKPIEEELALLRKAHQRLQAGDWQRALSYLAEHTWRFPRGELVEARSVATLLALCAKGDAARARREADRFRAAHPGSPYAERVRTICSP